MGKIIPFPGERPDVQEMMLDGKLETMLSARGVVLFHLSAWKVDGNEKAHNGLRGGAGMALAELDRLGEGEDAAWIKRTFARYVQDERALIQYMMN